MLLDFREISHLGADRKLQESIDTKTGSADISWDIVNELRGGSYRPLQYRLNV
jgi:hypothetical protein